jgi:torulene dioxygenase
MGLPIEQPRPTPAHYNDWPNAQGFDVSYEERSPVKLNVEGMIPSYAAGVLFRTGLGPRDVKTNKGKTFRVNHWFDNLSQIHRFQLNQPESDSKACSVTYNSRVVCDGMLENVKKTGNRQGLTFAAKYDPCMSYFQKLQAVFNPAWKRKPDEVAVAVTMSINFPGLSRTGEAQASSHDRSKVSTLCNKTDAPVFQMIDEQTLEPIGIAGQTTLHPLLKGAGSAAHAKSDPVTGDVFNYNLDFGRRPTYRIFTVSVATGKTSILATFTGAAAYLHSLFLTEHYIVLCVWNSHYKAGGASILYHQNIVDSLTYNDKVSATWFVVDKTPGGKGLVATYDSDPFYAFHTINAYEEQSTDGKVDIIADISAYENMTCLRRFYLDNLMSDSPAAKPYCDPSNMSGRPSIRRFRLPSVPSTAAKAKAHLKVESVWTAEKASSIELPTLNPAYVTKKHRYVYGVMDTGKSSFLDGLIKYDVSDHTTKVWSVHGHTAGEPIFIADPDSTEEDSGVLLSVVLDGYEGKSCLLCLDAKTMAEVGRANVDGAVGFGFHGTHVTNAEWVERRESRHWISSLLRYCKIVTLVVLSTRKAKSWWNSVTTKLG